MTVPNQNAPLRVVLVIGTLNRGGTEGQVVALAARLRQRGHLVRIVCMDKTGDLRDEATAAGVDVVEAGFPGITRKSPRALLRMYRGIREPRPDVVHCFLYLANIFGVPLGRLARARVVLMSERSLQQATGARWFFRPLVWLSHRLSDAIVCNSHAVLEDAVRSARMPAGKALVIHNGVEPADLGPPHAGKPLKIVVIANLIPYKGHDVLLHAFARVAHEVGPDVARLQFAGHGPAEPGLRRLASRLGIKDSVEFLGSVGDVRDLLRHCRFTVLSSRTEGFPNAVLESLACGRAAIASRVGGVAEILDQGGGVLVPPDNVEALAGAMLELIEDGARARELGEEGQRIATVRFGMERMVDETLGLYRYLL